jgi:hypothetical protein
MLDKDRRSSVRRVGDHRGTDARSTTTLWRMRSPMRDNQASCSVTITAAGCDVLVVFSKGLGVPERFPDAVSAMRHSMEIAGRLIAQGWVEVDAPDE